MSIDRITLKISIEFTLSKLWGLFVVCWVFFSSIFFRCLYASYILSRTVNTFIITKSFPATPYMDYQIEFVSYSISISVHHGQIHSFLSCVMFQVKEN